MSAIQKIFRKYGPEYIQRYGKRIPRVHSKVIRAISNCRSGAYGTSFYRCDRCGSTHAIPCSCGNRHCPACQQHKAAQWLAREQRKLLACHYFLLTVTLPKPLQHIIRSHQRLGYAALFSSTIAALKKLARDRRFLGTPLIGLVAVLHTWGAQLQYHPHLHLVIPGGGLSPDRSRWLSSRRDLFVHTKPLARIIRSKFRAALKSAGLLDEIDPQLWSQEWVVDSQAVGGGETTLRYLSRYVFRLAISNHRILSCENHSVTFQYKDSHSGKWRIMALDALEFIRRFLQHVLPSGFMKIRHCGFLSGNAALPLAKIQEMVRSFYKLLCETLQLPVSLPATRPSCPLCHGRLRRIWFFPPLRKEVLIE